MPQGAEFQVSQSFKLGQYAPRVASDTRGNFVVVWANQPYPCCSPTRIFGRRWDSDGVPQGSQFQVNSFTTVHTNSPSVASDADGNFVVVWDSYGQDGDEEGIFGQRYDSAGGPLGAEFRVNSYTTSTQRFPSVASDASGNFVVVWDSFLQDGDGFGVFGQRYDSTGAAQGAEFRVNSYTTSSQRFPSVASDADGNFVVAWHSGLQDGSGSGIFGQRYDSGGAGQGDEFQINSFTTGTQQFSSVASDADGNFVVAWRSNFQDGSGSGIFGQRYDSGGAAQGDEFQINSFTTGFQQFPSVGATGTNQFVVVWESGGGQDGSGFGVFGQRFDSGGGTITVVSPNTNVKWRIGSLHQIQWTHNLGVGETFRIELDRNDDGNYDELIAAAAPSDSASRGTFAWTVTGPPSGTARVRVSWTDERGVSDASDVTFQIRPVPLDGER